MGILEASEWRQALEHQVDRIFDSRQFRNGKDYRQGDEENRVGRGSSLAGGRLPVQH